MTRPTRSLLVAIALAYVTALACGWAVGYLLLARNDRLYVTPTFHAMDRLELEDAQHALVTGGPPALATYLTHLDRAFGGRHFLLRSDGSDVLTHQSLAQMLPPPPATNSRTMHQGRVYITQRSEDGSFWFAVISQQSTRSTSPWPYLAAGLTVTSALTLFTLFYLILPLRRIGEIVSRFGRGDRSARIRSTRQDEIGQLAAEIDEMAAGIEQNLRNERLLLEDISHELRAPLSRLTLAARLARSKGDVHTEPLLAQVESNVQRLSALVGEITDFHQRWSTAEKGPPAPTDLTRVVLSAIDLCRIEAEAKEVMLDPSLATVVLPSAQAELLLRVTENLLRNAITYSAPRSRIEIDLTRRNSQATLTVRDFGKGVAPEQLKKIFDAFYRAGPPESDYPRGLGLGLAIAKRGVHWHGGTILAENAYPGLRLIVILPM